MPGCRLGHDPVERIVAVGFHLHLHLKMQGLAFLVEPEHQPVAAAGFEHRRCAVGWITHLQAVAEHGLGAVLARGEPQGHRFQEHGPGVGVVEFVADLEEHGATGAQSLPSLDESRCESRSTMGFPANQAVREPAASTGATPAPSAPTGPTRQPGPP